MKVTVNSIEELSNELNKYSDYKHSKKFMNNKFFIFKSKIFESSTLNIKIEFGKTLVKVIEIQSLPKTYDYIENYINYVGQEINNNKSGNKIILDLLNMCMGNSIEANEVLGVLQKNVFFGKEYEKWKMIDELSDNLFYFVGIMRLIGTNFEEVINANMIKLKSRYPDGRRNLSVFINKNKEKEKVLIQELIDKNEKNGKSKNPEIQ